MVVAAVSIICRYANARFHHRRNRYKKNCIYKRRIDTRRIDTSGFSALLLDAPTLALVQGSYNRTGPFSTGLTGNHLLSFEVLTNKLCNHCRAHNANYSHGRHWRSLHYHWNRYNPSVIFVWTMDGRLFMKSEIHFFLLLFL
ncbi:hypothetical protein YC2023_033486 [Brassica napus]